MRYLLIACFVSVVSAQYFSDRYTSLEFNVSRTSATDGNFLFEVSDNWKFSFFGVYASPGYINTRSANRRNRDVNVCDYYGSTVDLNNLVLQNHAKAFCAKEFGTDDVEVIIDNKDFGRSCLNTGPTAVFFHSTDKYIDQLLASTGVVIERDHVSAVDDDDQEVTTLPSTEAPHGTVTLVGGYVETASLTYDSITPTKPSQDIPFTVPFTDFITVPNTLPNLPNSFQTGKFQSYSLSEPHIVSETEKVFSYNSSDCVRASLYARFQNIKSFNYQIPVCMQGLFGCKFSSPVSYRDLSNTKFQTWWVDYSLLDNTVNRCYRINGAASVKSSDSYYIKNDGNCADSFPCSITG